MVHVVNLWDIDVCERECVCVCECVGVGVYAYGVKVKVACVKECLCVITIIAAVFVVRALVEGERIEARG